MKKAIVYADRHSSIACGKCDNILKNYIKNNKKDITHIIDLGDEVDNPFMSDFPVEPEFILTPQEEFDLYASHIKELQKIVPKAEFHLIPGNHSKSRLNNKKKLNRGLASLRNLEYESVVREALKNANVNTKKFKIHNRNKHIMFTKEHGAVFTHGDPRLDYNVKGGATGLRRTAEMYPTCQDIIMGHGHRYICYPRRFIGKQAVMLGGMFDIEEMKNKYESFHPYENGFMIIHYDNKRNFYQKEYVRIRDGKCVIGGKLYN